MKKLVYLLIFTALLITGCKGIEKNDAEQIAVDFVDANVKFFTRDGEKPQDLLNYGITQISSYQEGKDWIVVVEVSADYGNETKKRSMAVKIDNKGEVLEFNGVKLPR